VMTEDDTSTIPEPAAAPWLATLNPGRLRQFQRWFRHIAPMSWRRVHLAAEMERSLRLPRCGGGPHGKRRWVAAVAAFWRLQPAGRDALGTELAVAVDPDWPTLQYLLACSYTSNRTPRPLHGPAGSGRRGRGFPRIPRIALPTQAAELFGSDPGWRKASRQAADDIVTIKTWHEVIVSGTACLVAELADNLCETGLWTSSKAAAALKTLPGCGPYLATNIINTMLLRGLLQFDEGVLGPGAIRSLAFLQGADNGTRVQLQNAGLWPDAPDSAGWRRIVEELAWQENCHWIDIQSGLCFLGPCLRKPRRVSSSRPHIRDANRPLPRPDPVSLAHSVVDYLQKLPDAGLHNSLQQSPLWQLLLQQLAGH
jgi:hypothetical protein